MGTACPLGIPAGAVNRTTELFESTGRRRSLGLRARWHDGETVRKLHKVSEKPVLTLGFSIPGVVSKKPHPFAFMVIFH